MEEAVPSFPITIELPSIDEHLPAGNQMTILAIPFQFPFITLNLSGFSRETPLQPNIKGLKKKE